MKKIIQIGLTPIQTATTASSNLITPKFYDVELSDELDTLCEQDGITAKCLNLKGCISEGENEDDAIKNITEAIHLMEEEQK